MWFEREGRVVISLPGVPFEMEHLMEEEVMPRLKGRFSLRSIVHRTLITSGLAESMLAERIAPWENALPAYLKLAYLPNPGAVRLRLSAYEVEGAKVREEISEVEAEMLAGDKVNMEKEFGDLLFSLVNAARLYGINPDNALEMTNAKFRNRFGYVEERTLRQGRNLRDMSLDEMDALWNEAKKLGV
jgi:uncharacterized protein YabN with tetrapyrrole methylase and pyrophosphatase domain